MILSNPTYLPPTVTAVNLETIHLETWAIDRMESQDERIERLEAALRCCIPADGEAARLKHEALLQEA
jgi:hypothetical protein